LQTIARHYRTCHYPRVRRIVASHVTETNESCKPRPPSPACASTSAARTQSQKEVKSKALKNSCRQLHATTAPSIQQQRPSRSQQRTFMGGERMQGECYGRHAPMSSRCELERAARTGIIRSWRAHPRYIVAGARTDDLDGWSVLQGLWALRLRKGWRVGMAAAAAGRAGRPGGRRNRSKPGVICKHLDRDKWSRSDRDPN
jgi:hypothetical protein